MRSKTDRVICGTCQYWTGMREPVFDGNGKPKIDIHDSEGLCENPHSNFDGAERKSGMKCCKYSKWTEIL